MEDFLISNPFVVGKYLSDRYFCDRENDTEFLRKQIVNGRNVALISPRRIGKSGLIQHFFNQPDIQEAYHVFYVDIYATTSLGEFVYTLGKTSLGEFVYTLGKEIYEQLKPQSTVWKEKFFQIVSSFRVGFKLDAMTGLPGLDIGLGDIQVPQTTLDEIFSYIAESDKPCVIAIDEFQQIGEYAERNVEALLRTKIQQCQKAQFIFSGSKRHTMTNMFNSPAKPFYQSAISMGLEAIPVNTYTDFAVRLFEEYGKHVDREVIKHVWAKYDGYTWFVQMVMNELFALTARDEACTMDMVDAALQNVILSQENSYKTLLSNLPPRQKMVLQAIAKEGVARNVTSMKFVKQYNLGSASSVQSAVRLLLQNDLITQEDGCYRVYDYFFSTWLSEIF